MGGVLDYSKAKLRRERGDLRHGARIAREMNRNYNLRQPTSTSSSLQLGAKGVDRDVPCLGINVYEVNIRTAISRAVRACDECDRTCPDHITWADPE